MQPITPQQQLNTLYQQLTTLKEEKDRLNEEARKWTEKRDKIHAEIKNLRNEALSLKEKRDELNRKVKELKESREQAKTERQAKREEIIQLNGKMKTILENRSARNMHDLQAEKDSLEWEIQTTSLTVKDEQPIIEKIKTIEAQLLIHKQIQELENNITKLHIEEKTLGIQSKIRHEELSEFAKQSQEIHAKMVGTMEKVRTLKTEADDMHQKFIEIKQHIAGMHQKTMEIENQIAEIKQQIHQVEEERRSKTQQQILEEVKKKAQEKVKRGEKLSWEEFQILAQEGLSDKEA